MSGMTSRMLHYQIHTLRYPPPLESSAIRGHAGYRPTELLGDVRVDALVLRGSPHVGASTRRYLLGACYAMPGTDTALPTRMLCTGSAICLCASSAMPSACYAMPGTDAAYPAHRTYRPPRSNATMCESTPLGTFRYDCLCISLYCEIRHKTHLFLLEIVRSSYGFRCVTATYIISGTDLLYHHLRVFAISSTNVSYHPTRVVSDLRPVPNVLETPPTSLLEQDKEGEVPLLLKYLVGSLREINAQTHASGTNCTEPAVFCL
eukprot:3941318-Rhodomonas_salina.2